jgi:hypothetical protein
MKSRECGWNSYRVYGAGGGEGGGEVGLKGRGNETRLGIGNYTLYFPLSRFQFSFFFLSHPNSILRVLVGNKFGKEGGNREENKAGLKNKEREAKKKKKEKWKKRSKID